MTETLYHPKNMVQKSWMSWVLLLWICLVCVKSMNGGGNPCLNQYTFVGDKFYSKPEHNVFQHNCNQAGVCLKFLHKVTQTSPKDQKDLPQLEVRDDGSHLLYLTNAHKRNNQCLRVMYGRNCDAHLTTENDCDYNNIKKGDCHVVQFQPKEACDAATYNHNLCNAFFSAFPAMSITYKYIINITQTNKNCINCKNPVAEPETTVKLDKFQLAEGQELKPSEANDLMNSMAFLASNLTEETVGVSAGDGVTGIITVQKVEEAENVEELSFAYASLNSTMKIVESGDRLLQFMRTATISKEAFEKAHKLSNGTVFVAVLRFTNLAKDEGNSSVLGNEVLAIEMGQIIKNLTDNITINFRNVKEAGSASCQSWNGQGNLPNWTDNGCRTIRDGDNITCQCSHLTFFAVLLSPPNIAMSSSNLSSLTTITNIGCGLSMFFLSIALFMHFLLRRAKASLSTKILINLISAMFLLNLTFLTNNWVAKMKNSVGCKIMAALTHYFMLVTFTWFAVEAFHLCLQLYMAGKVTIRHYILKVSITSWALPGVIVAILLIKVKYGEQIIITESTNVTMCWVIDNDVHYIVNIGYYVLVFLFTFTTFILILCWLYCLSLSKAGHPQTSQNGKSIATILGLCCILGITWGFAFFAYGVLRVPSYYIFTILNSLQGFFLFVYYYYQSKEIQDGSNTTESSSSSTNTMKTTVENKNPYLN